MSDSSVPFLHPWPERALREVGSVTVGGTPSTGVPEYWGGAIPWMTSGDVHGRLIDDVPTRISGLGLRRSSATIVDPPSIAVALAGQGRTRGTAAYIRCALCTNQSVALLKANLGELDPKYLLNNLSFRYSELRSRSAGGGRAGLTKTILEQLPLPFPPLPEQSKIGEVLSTIDRAIEQSEALIDKQKRIKTGLMQDLLTRGIDEQGNLRSERSHEFRDSPVGRIPMEWEAVTLGTILRCARGYLQTGPFGSQLHAHEYTHEGTPVIMPQDILNGQISTRMIARIPKRRAHELGRHRLWPNDVVFSRRGELSRAARIGEREAGWICGTGCFLLRASPNVIDSTWLASVYRHDYVQRQVKTNAVGSTMPSLNNEVMKSLTIALPKPDEQQEIVRRCDAASDSIASSLDQLTKMRALKRGLMEDLLTGNRRVSPLLELRVGATT